MTEVTDGEIVLDFWVKNADLWQVYQAKKAERPLLFPTEGAQALGVSELELMLASPNSRYLGTDCRSVLLALPRFGEVLSIVRNEFAVHEKRGVLQNLNLGEKMGLAINVGGLDLRFFMTQWRYVLAIEEVRADKSVYALQFFDGAGGSISKVFLQDLSEENLLAWQDLIQTHAQKAQDTPILLTKLPQKTPWQFQALNPADKARLHSEWQAMQDVHQFHFLLKKLGIDRASSYHQAPEGMAQQLDPSAIAALFEKAQQSQCPIMIFVGNTGVVQIQTGQVYTLKRMGDWYNILDQKQTQFTLHLNDGALSQVWCVKRPTKDGIITCIEGFDKVGNSIITLFGERLEGQSELLLWRDLCQQIQNEYADQTAPKTA